MEKFITKRKTTIVVIESIKKLAVELNSAKGHPKSILKDSSMVRLLNKLINLIGEY